MAIHWLPAVLLVFFGLVVIAIAPDLADHYRQNPPVYCANPLFPKSFHDRRKIDPVKEEDYQHYKLKLKQVQVST